MIPGELITADGEIELNSGRKLISVTVANIGDRPIQIGSHYHFYEANEGLIFDRPSTLGYRLNIASGTAVRFEPGQERTVELVEFAGDLPPLLFDHAKKDDRKQLAGIRVPPRKSSRSRPPSREVGVDKDDPSEYGWKEAEHARDMQLHYDEDTLSKRWEEAQVTFDI